MHVKSITYIFLLISRIITESERNPQVTIINCDGEIFIQ